MDGWMDGCSGSGLGGHWFWVSSRRACVLGRE